MQKQKSDINMTSGNQRTLLYDGTFGNGDSLEFDRNGIPVFEGRVALLDEYVDRCWDIFWGRSGDDSKQAATPIHLRAGCRGVVYEAVKHLSHKDLITTSVSESGKMEVLTTGLETFLDTVRQALQKEAPIQEAEEFDRVFYAESCWRGRGESMQAYIVRRNQEFLKLNSVVEGGCVIPEKIRAHLLLRFAGLTLTQRTSILASCSNVIDKAAFEKALRMQYPTIHDSEVLEMRSRPPPPRPLPHPPRPHVQPRRSGKGSGAGRSRAAHLAEEFLHDEEPQEDEALVAGDADPEAEGSDDADIDAYVSGILSDCDVEAMEDEDVQALAIAAQVRRKNFKKSAVVGSKGGPPSSSSGTFGVRGTLTLEEKKKKKEREANKAGQPPKVKAPKVKAQAAAKPEAVPKQ